MPDDDRELFHAMADIFGRILDKDEAERSLLHESADRCADARKNDPFIADVQAELLASIEEVEAARRLFNAEESWKPPPVVTNRGQLGEWASEVRYDWAKEPCRSGGDRIAFVIYEYPSLVFPIYRFNQAVNKCNSGEFCEIPSGHMVTIGFRSRRDPSRAGFVVGIHLAYHESPRSPSLEGLDLDSILPPCPTRE